MAGMSEAAWEHLVMDEPAELAWEPKDGKQIASGSGERESWNELIIPRRLREAIAAINPALRRDVTTDWVARDDVRAKIRSTIKRLLAKYGYPPDAEADAIKRVLDQMETFAEDWSPEA
jgi:hypothetical protein